MNPTTRATNLRELLSRLGIEPATFADIADLTRMQVGRWVRGENQWTRIDSAKQAAKALGMDVLEFERFLDGETHVQSVLPKARASVGPLLTALEQRRVIARRVHKAASKFEDETGEPVMDGLEAYASAVAWKLAGPNPSDAQITRTVAYLQEAMASVAARAYSEFSTRADSAPQPPPSGSIRRAKRR